jgi:hypothetical protein
MARNESAIRAVTTPDHGWRVVVDKVVRSIPPERPCHSQSERSNARRKKEARGGARSQERLGHSDAVSRATPRSGSPLLNLTRGEYCLPWKKVPLLRHILPRRLLAPGFWLLTPPTCTPSSYAAIALLCGSLMLTSIFIPKKCRQIL